MVSPGHNDSYTSADQPTPSQVMNHADLCSQPLFTVAFWPGTTTTSNAAGIVFAWKRALCLPAPRRVRLRVVPGHQLGRVLLTDGRRRRGSFMV